jgi:hypothetical protein
VQGLGSASLTAAWVAAHFAMTLCPCPFAHVCRAWVAASLTPTKDMELLIAVEALPRQHDIAISTAAASIQTTTSRASACSTHGDSQGTDDGSGHLGRQQTLPGATQTGLENPAFCRALHAGLRTLTDRMGVESFNVGILNVPTGSNQSTSHQQQDSSSNGRKDSGESSPQKCKTSDTVRDCMTSGNVGSAGDLSSHPQASGSVWPAGWEPQGPLLLARVVSRGRMSQPASDYGCVEVSVCVTETLMYLLLIKYCGSIRQLIHKQRRCMPGGEWSSSYAFPCSGRSASRCMTVFFKD